MKTNKDLWALDRKKNDLKYPDENVIRFLYHNRSIMPGKNILDFGCGSGRNTKIMADMGLNIYAMDYNQDCLELTKQKLSNYKNIQYINNTENTILLENNSMDCIVAWGALFCLSHEKSEKLLENLIKALKPGGLMLADYRAKDDQLYGRGALIEKDFYKLDETCGSLAGIDYLFYDIDELLDLYKRMKMTVFNYEKLEHYMDNCEKKNSRYIIWSKKE